MSPRRQASLLALLTVLAAPAIQAQRTVPFEYTHADASFGAAVVPVGDTNLDGFADFAIGCPNGGPNSEGFVRLYSGLDGSLLYEVFGLFSGDRFGSSITGLGDVDGDQRVDFAVGAPQGAIPYPPGAGIQYSLYAAGYVRLHSGQTGALIGSIPATPSPAHLSLTPILFGSTIADVGDINADGTHDLLVTKRGGGGFFPGGCSNTGVGLVAGRAEIYSGQTGALLRFHQGLAGDHWPTRVANVGDINNDGSPDYAVAGIGRPPSQQTCLFQTLVVPYSGSRLQVFSGTTGFPIQTHLSDPLQQLIVAPLGDVNGDGRTDIIGRGMTPANGAYGCFTAVFASPAGGFIHTYTEAFPNSNVSAAAAGDRNGDGRADFLLGDSFFSRVRVCSGLDGSVLETLTGPPGFGQLVADLGDLDGDGRSEFAATTSGLVRIYWGSPLSAAQATVIGPGCGGGALPPSLELSGLPILGTTITLTYEDGTPFAPGAFLAGSPIPFPLSLSSTCLAYLDPSAPLILGTFSLDVAGAASVVVPLPSVPLVAGLPIRLQAFAASPTTSLGIEVTDAWHLVFGY